MANNITYPIAAATVVATKDQSSVHYQKILVGAMQRTYDGVQSLALSGSSQSLTVPGSATHAEVICESATSTDYARFWQDGTAPTSAVGIQLLAGQAYDSAAPASFKAINGVGSCTLRIQYYHYA